MSGSLVLRPVRATEAGVVWDMLSAATDTVGMGSLPQTAAAAETLCDRSSRLTVELATGAHDARPGEVDRILFVLEDEGSVLGVTGCSFTTEIPNLGVRIETGEDGEGLIMRAVAQSWTRTELDSSYLAPSARGRGAGTLLSRGRFLFLHLISAQVPTAIVSHIRGMFDASGTAPFWEHFGARLAPQWETSVHAETALASNAAQLQQLAGRPIPLTPAVLDCLGRVNEASLPAFRTLAREGLRPTELFDPVDGGPTVAAALEDTHSGQHRRHGRLRTGGGDVDALVSTATRDGFTVTRTLVDSRDVDTVGVDPDAMTALGLAEDGLVVVAPLGPPT